jgi:topoisomerase-4 subunit B
MTDNASNYGASSIKVLKGLEPVKQRPGMYTRTDNPLHMIQEVIDNGADEALGGYAKSLEVEMCADGSVRIADDGRGIPVDMQIEEGIPAVEAVFTKLHSGGKFDKTSGDGAYKFSGGLHGVGVSVTNALSDSLVCTVERDGGKWEIGFNNGDLVTPLRKLGSSSARGTQVVAKPNPKYFDSPEIPVAELKALLQSKAILLPGFKVTFIDSRGAEPIRIEWQYSNGLAGYLNEMAGGYQPIVPLFEGSRYATADDGTFSEGEGAQWAFSWYEHGKGEGQSYVNLIPTPEHGTHVSGLKSALFESLKAFIDHHGMLPKGVKLTGDDVFKNVMYVLSGRMLDPQFAGQTKDKLNSREGVKLVERMVQPSLEAWLNKNVAQAKQIADLAIRHAMARQRSAQKAERKKSSSVVMLPGKLTDCESDDASRNELFLVEGDSAGGSAKMARDKEFQAILPLRGKGLNTWEKDRLQAMANNEVHDISVAIGVEPHTLADEVDLSKLRYHKICILADADVDGFHIQVLLLTLFLKHFPHVVDKGHIYIACPPLYRLDADAVGKKKPARKIYAMDEAELKSWEDRFTKEGHTKLKVGRFKGLGEMNPPELWETTLDPATRRLMQVNWAAERRTEVHATFDLLMNSSNAGARRKWMETRGSESTLGE